MKKALSAIFSTLTVIFAIGVLGAAGSFDWGLMDNVESIVCAVVFGLLTGLCGWVTVLLDDERSNNNNGR